MLAPADFLQNRRRIVRQFGRGGMGPVYEATDERLGRTGPCHAVYKGITGQVLC